MTDDLAFVPVKAVPPWGKPCMVEIPEQFWSDDWLQGVRSKTVLGTICSHHAGGVCVQPAQYSQAVRADCTVIDPDKVTITVLDGKLSDYQ